MNTSVRNQPSSMERASQDIEGRIEGFGWVTTSQLAKALGLSRKALYARLTRSVLPDGTVRRWGSTLLINLEKLSSWIGSGRGAD